MFLISSTTIGEDLRYNHAKIQYYWNFINKLWNGANFISTYKPQANKITKLHPFNQYIINEFNRALIKITKNMDGYNFVVANKYLTDFIWETYCNRYLEYIKPLLKNNNATKQQTINIAHTIFKNILTILHPHCPFVTERLYIDMYHNTSIMLTTWPTKYKISNNAKIENLNYVFTTIHGFIRDLRIKHGLKSTQILSINLITTLKFKLSEINQLLNLFNIHIEQITTKRTSTNTNVAIFNHLTIEYDAIANESTTLLNKLTKEKLHLENELKRSQAILNNKNFLNKAPINKVNLEKQKLKDYQNQYDQIKLAISKIK
jgi:valyl-tRNA synthetase